MRPLWFVLVLPFVAVPPAPASAQVLYTVTDLGPGEALAVNNAGQVAVRTTLGGSVHGFRWSAAIGLVDIGSVSNLQGTADLALNNSGQVAGTNDALRAFRTTPTGRNDAPGADLGTVLGMSAASGINDLGQVVGTDFNFGVPERAFRTTATGGVTAASLLAMPANAVSSRGFGINASGQVTGGVSLAGAQSQHAFRTTPTGDLTDPNADLGVLPGFTGSV